MLLYLHVKAAAGDLTGVYAEHSSYETKLL